MTEAKRVLESLPAPAREALEQAVSFVPRPWLYGGTFRATRSLLARTERMPIAVVHAVALVKKAAALVNRDLGLLPEEKVCLIVAAAEEVVAGRFDAEFPLSIFQGGSGTATNMNVNEVIANRAIELAGGTRGSRWFMITDRSAGGHS